MTMWLLVVRTRTPRPDAPYWPGRRGCAVLDAVAWPLAWIVATTYLPNRGGLVGALVVAVACLAAAGRLYHAIFGNQRYHFTTWRWGRVALVLFLIGWAVKWTLMSGQ